MRALAAAYVLTVLASCYAVDRSCGQDSAEGCLCRNDVLQCSGLLQVPRAPPEAWRWPRVDLSHNALEEIRNVSLWYDIRYLSLSHNRIATVESGAFAAASELLGLDLSWNFVAILTDGVFSALQKLQTLNLAGNAFTEVPHRRLSPLMSIRTLNLSNNFIRTPYLGDGLHNARFLSTIDMSSNSFVRIDKNAFKAALMWDDRTSVSLLLSNCSLRNIPTGCLSPLFRLHHLDLSDNPSLTSNAIQTALRDIGRSRLRRLSLSRTNQTHVEVGQLTRLLELDLSGNPLRNITPRAFYFLRSLERLDLSHCQLRVVGGLSGLTELRHLKLAGNHLSTMDNTALEPLSALRTLDLSRNSLSTLEDETFMSLWELTDLDVSYNEIRQISLRGLESLRRLNLNSNPLQRLGAFATRLPRLRYLSVSNNGLTRMERDTLSRAQSLEMFDVSHNRISRLHPRALGGASVKTIDLSHNVLNSFQYLGWSSLAHLNVSNNIITNVSQNAFRSADMLLSLDLSANDLASLPRSLLSPTRHSLRSLDLSDNPRLAQFIDSPHAYDLLELQQIRSLDLSATSLQQVPVWLPKLSELTSLDVSRNQLTNVPLSWEKEPPLINASYNSITSPGEVSGSLDLAGNPFSCTCEIAGLARWLQDTGSDRLSAYTCALPAEWRGARVTDFYAKATWCRRHEHVILAACLAALLVLLLVAIGVLVYRCRRRRREKKKHQERSNYCVIENGSTIQINPIHVGHVVTPETQRWL